MEAHALEVVPSSGSIGVLVDPCVVFEGWIPLWFAARNVFPGSGPFLSGLTMDVGPVFFVNFCSGTVLESFIMACTLGGRSVCGTCASSTLVRH